MCISSKMGTRDLPVYAQAQGCGHILLDKSQVPML